MALAPEDSVEVGTAVNGSQSESVGTVVEVLTDPRDGRATWAWVAVGHAHGLLRAVPLDAAVRTAGGVSVPFTKAFVATAPEAVLPSRRELFPAAVVTAEQDRLRTHYGFAADAGAGRPRAVGRTPLRRGRRLVFHGLLVVGLAWGAVEGVRSSVRRGRS